MRLRNKWIPHPLLSVSLIVIWQLLANDLAIGSLLLGTVLGVAIPLLINVFWLKPPTFPRPVLMLRFALRVLLDIFTANFEVAKLILGPGRKLQPAFVVYPLELRDDFAISILANTVSLTPGTVSTDISDDRRQLLIHGLNVADDQALIQGIKQRYEQPLLEIFPCSTT